MPETTHVRIARILKSAILLAFAQSALADDIYWIGSTPGFTDVQLNWSSSNIPGPFDTAYFNTPGGSISFNAGTFDPQAIQLETDQWTFSNGTLITSEIRNQGGENNVFDATVTLTGAENFLVATSDYRLQIDGPIVDRDLNIIDVYLRAALTGNSTYTGATRAWESLELTGPAGAITGSPFIDMTESTLRLDNSNGENLDRLSAMALLTLRYGAFEMTGAGIPETHVAEEAGSMLIDRGGSRIRFVPGDGDETQTVQLHLTDNVQSLTANDRGTAIIQTEYSPALGVGAKLTMATLPDGLTPGSTQVEQLVPYVTAESPDTYAYAPVIYDSGEDEETGTSDDVGLRALYSFETTPMPTITNDDTQHAVTAGSFITGGALAMNSLTLGYDFDPTVLEVTDSLHLKSGVVVINGDGAIIGAGTITSGSNDELHIHAPGFGAEVAAHLDALTIVIGGEGEILLSGSNTVDELYKNGGRLILGDENAAGTGMIVLTEADLQVDFSQPLHNSIRTRGGKSGPTGGGAIIRSLDFGDNVTRTMTGRLEGDGPIGLFTQNTKLILTNTASNEFADSPFLFISQNNILQLDGTFGSTTTYTGLGFGQGGTLWLSDTATLMGSGFADCSVVVTNNTKMSPGNDTGQPIATFTAHSLNLFSGGVLEMDVAATGTRGVDYDALDVMDTTLFLNGTIKLIRGASNLPVGSTFDIIHHDGQRFGNPALDVDNALTGGKQYVKIFYADKLVIGIAGDDGDANLDGAVNTLDFNMLAGNFGVNSGANWLMGDFDYSFGVDSMDFNIFAGNYGKKIPGPGAALGNVVPEPMTGIAAFSSLLVAFASRKRRNQFA